MFPFPIAKPQKCDIQTFYNTFNNPADMTMVWNKPAGVSHVYMLLIGGGGNGDGSTTGGGAGATTVWYGSAQHVPDNLQVTIGSTQSGSEIKMFSRGAPVQILLALGAVGGTGATQMSPNFFAASGFFNSTPGPNGSTGNVTPSAYSFLTGGAISTNDVTSQYGYRNASTGASVGGPGYFLMRPAIVGIAGSQAFNGGIGCGGGSTTTGTFGYGGPGMVLIASW